MNAFTVSVLTSASRLLCTAPHRPQDITWDDKGADRVWVRQYGSGLDKRQATMQLCITPGGKVIRTAMIFKGASDDFYYSNKPIGYKPDPDNGFPADITCEADLYPEDVFVTFNKCAWATPAYSLQWMKECFAKVRLCNPDLLLSAAIRPVPPLI